MIQKDKTIKYTQRKTGRRSTAATEPHSQAVVKSNKFLSYTLKRKNTPKNRKYTVFKVYFFLLKTMYQCKFGKYPFTDSEDKTHQSMV